MKSILLLIFCFTLCPLKTLAQIIPDNTLGGESSKINSIDELRTAIEGGAIRGDNLFHSFQEFSVNEGLSVDFANPAGITNIFSRVTGSNISEIFGTLGVDGAANLFLMNPNGIVFGENAAINVNGSFVATTAEGIDFNSGDRFSAVELNKPILTLDFPIGLGMGSNPGNILVKGSGHNLVDPFVGAIQQKDPSPDNGLQVQLNQSLALIGGNVVLEGGILTAEGGHIEIASIGRGQVSLITDTKSSNPSFDYTNVTDYKDIQLLSSSLVNASGIGSGSINLNGANIDVVDGSVIWLQNQGNQSSQDININATKEFQITGTTETLPGTRSGIYSETISEGRGADLNISANNLTITNDGAVSTISYSLGNGGDLAVNTYKLNVFNGGNLATASSGVGNGGNLSVKNQNSLDVVGFSPLFPESFSAIFSATSGGGKGGNIEVETVSLSIKDTGSIGTRVSINGEGQGGNINLDVLDTTRIFGQTDFDNFTTLVSTSFGSGNAGSIILDTHDLVIKGKSAIAASSFAQGNAGELLIDVTNSSQITNGTISSSVEEFPQNISSIFTSNTPPLTGDAGKIRFNSPNLEINNGGSIAASNQGTGNAGNLEINADTFSLNNGGEISASTASGEGGNITLNAENLKLQNQSQISASAGGSGNGGNITIDSDTILGIENSDITANAVRGNGGNITINSNTLIGFEESSILTPNSDITASSEFGVDGTVTINSPESNADEDVVVSAKEIDLDLYRKLFKGSCLDPNRKGRQELVYIGGGRPESPYNFFDESEPTVLGNGSSSELKSNNIPPLWQEGDPLIEPNAVQTNANGRKFLVAVEEREISEANVCNRDAQDLEPK